MARTSYAGWNTDDDIHFILDQQTESTDGHVVPLENIILTLSQSVFDWAEAADTNFYE